MEVWTFPGENRGELGLLSVGTERFSLLTSGTRDFDFYCSERGTLTFNGRNVEVLTSSVQTGELRLLPVRTEMFSLLTSGTGDFEFYHLE